VSTMSAAIGGGVMHRRSGKNGTRERRKVDPARSGHVAR